MDICDLQRFERKVVEEVVKEMVEKGRKRRKERRRFGFMFITTNLTDEWTNGLDQNVLKLTMKQLKR